MKVAVIGAGASGLVSAKLCLEEGFECDIFEVSDKVGGTWIYEEKAVNKYGFAVNSSAYKNLRTNLPKEVMEFDGLHYPFDDISFLPASLVLDYLVKYAEKYDILKHVKFEYLIFYVAPFGKKWEIKGRNLCNKVEEVDYYDTVFVCSGHFSVPYTPAIEGSATFSGLSMHSHEYKTPDIFHQKSILLIGMGPSAQDILFDVHQAAKQVYVSHHGSEHYIKAFPSSIIHKPDVKAISEDCIRFTDDTLCNVDAILYCTGYYYSFPFLAESCGITIEDNYVYPLYKQLLSIPFPTMAFIGIPFGTFIFPLLELQVKCFINILMGRAKLPSESDMKADMKAWERSIKCPKKKNHLISGYVEKYFNDIASIGNIDPPPKVLFRIYEKTHHERRKDLEGYRKIVFRILDDYNYSINYN